MRLLQLTIILLSIHLLSVRAQLCPAPFSLEAGKCVFVSTAQSHNWCEANRQCKSIGGELLNSYSSLQLLSKMPSFKCGCIIWLGASDLADERRRKTSGWQRIHDYGFIPNDNSLWRRTDPSNAGNNEDCIAQFRDSYGKIADVRCSKRCGFACEFVDDTPSKPFAGAIWKRTPFKRTSYHASSEYCYTDVLNVHSEAACLITAFNSGSSRHVLYNSKLRACRLLLFTDAQVEEEIETSADWVKFSLK